MSSFTRFNAKMAMQYEHEASVYIGAPYYQVLNGFRYYIGHTESGEWIDVPAGYLTDGASVPPLLQGLVPAMGSYGQAAALHDWLCENPFYWDEGQGTWIEIDRATIDAIFYEAMKVLKVERWRFVCIRAGVTGYRLITRPEVPHMEDRKRKWLAKQPR